MDIIENTPVITHLSGQVYLSTMDAVNALKDV
jgi:SulP family sulfate permease